jgi:hypothetical protein
MTTARWVALWAAMLALLTAVMFVFGDLDAYSPWLLGGTAAGALALALAAVRAEPRRRTVLDVPDVSVAPGILALGVALLVGGSEVGTWMLLLGAGVALLGLGVLARERRLRRRAR